MENLEIIFILLLSSVFLVGLAQKIKVPYPIILIMGGALISFIPGLENIYFNPNLVLTMFLPPVLYFSAFSISIREFQSNWKNIFSLALGLVLFTTIIVGIVFKWLFPQFSWGFCFAFGAIVSPPDAIAVTSILKRFSINSRLVTMLEGESLINDASAIVIYKIAMIAFMTGTLSLTEGISEFFYVALGGVLVGAMLGIFFQEFSRRFLEPILGVVFSITIPYVTYIVADNLGVSGVLAVVVNGLIGARILHHHRSSLRRILGYAVWDVLIILVNCLVFILIGLQVKAITEKMSTDQMFLYSGYALLIAFVMVAVRFLWVYGRAFAFYRKSPRFTHILQEATLISWSGMRGIVSLAVAISLPFTMLNGEVLEGRNELVFITFMVILLTLLIPGFTLPSLIRYLNLQSKSSEANEKSIRQKLAVFAQEEIRSHLDSKSINQKEYRFLKSYFHSQHRVLELAHEDEEISTVEIVRRKVIHFQRSKLVEIWKMQLIDDKLLNHLESELDMIETHTARAELKR